MPGVDFLRALACIMVLLHHLMFRVDYDSAPDLAKPAIDFLFMGSFGVSVFFMLSGYLLARPFWQALDENRPMPSLRTYAIRRAARILPGFYLALTVTFVLSFTAMGARLDGQLFGRYLAGLALVSDWHWVTLFPVEFNGPLWSIGFETTSYVLLPLCLVLLFKARQAGASRARLRWLWLAVVIGVLAVHALIVAYAPIDNVDRGWDHGNVGGAKAWMPNYNPIGFFVIFALGALAAGVQVLLRAYRHWLFDILCLAGLAGAALGMVAHEHGGTDGFGLFSIPYDFPGFPLAIGLVLVAAPSSLVFGRWTDNRLSRAVARVSFGVYLWHFLIIALMARFLPPAFDTGFGVPFLTWLVSAAAAIILSFTVASLSFHWLENPVVKWARGLEHRDARPGFVGAEGQKT